MKLGRLVGNRRLYGDELFQAAFAMGQLTMHLYEPNNDSAEGERPARRSSTGGVAIEESGQDIYLLVTCRAALTVGSDEIHFDPEYLGKLCAV